MDLYYAKVMLFYLSHDKHYHYHLHLSDVNKTKEFILGSKSSYHADDWLNALEDHIMMANFNKKSSIVQS